MSEDVDRWLDFTGDKILEAPHSEKPTGSRLIGGMYSSTHWIFKARDTPIQALSICGVRVHEVPGRKEVDCIYCLDEAEGYFQEIKEASQETQAL